MDADTRDVGIDAAGFGHEFVASGVDFLAGLYKGVEVGKDLVCSSFAEDREVRIEEAFVHAVIRCDWIAFCFVLFKICFEVGNTAIPEF